MRQSDENKDRFKRLAASRTRNVLRALKVLGNCSNRNAYEYTDKEIEIIFSAIEKQLRVVKNKFQGSGHDKIDFRL